MNYHLAILAKGWSELILDGKKTIESRFTKVRCAPFGKIHAGDVVNLKERAGWVKGMFRVAKVETFENLTRSTACDIFNQYCNEIFVDFHLSSPSGYSLEYRLPKKWLEAKHATLIHIRNPVTFETPFPVPKRDARSWVVLEQPLHKCEMCEDRYLLEVYEDPDSKLIHGSEHFCWSCYARECVSPDEELALAMADSQD